MSDVVRINAAQRQINRILSNLASKEEIQEVIKGIIQIWDPETGNASLLINNLNEAIQRVKRHEHQSGLLRTLVASVSGNNISNIQLVKALGIHRTTVSPAKRRRLTWNTSETYISLHIKPTIHRIRVSKEVTEAIQNWMKHVFTPSSNSSNVIRHTTQDGVVEYEVKHWRTDSYNDLWAQWNAEHGEYTGECGRTYFISLIPWYVRKKHFYSGLCFHHELGRYFTNALRKARKIWHESCNCDCIYCTECQHGTMPQGNGSCVDGSCTRCQNVECPVEWSPTEEIEWKEHYYTQNERGKQVLVEEVQTTTREYFSSRVAHELINFQQHAKHVQHWKYMYKPLLDNLQPKHVVIRWDFIENYVREKNYAISSSHFGKTQSTLLTACVYWMEDGVLRHSYFDFVSAYLSHNDYYYGQSLEMLLAHLQQEMELDFDRVFIVTDGGRYFVSRFVWWYNNLYSQQFHCIICHWISPPCHGKGECDGHGAVVKTKAKTFLLVASRHIHNAEEFKDFLNSTINNTMAFNVLIPNEDIETHEVSKVFKFLFF